MLVSAGAAIFLVLANLALPQRIRLIGVAILLVPQVYLPGLPTSLAVLWTLTTCLAGLTMHGRSRADSPFVVVLGLLAAVTAVSLLWALPAGIHLGVATAMYGVLFLLALREMIVVAKADSGLLDTIVLWIVPGIAVQSVLTIIFQFSPELEERFLQSGLAAVTMGPAAEHLYTDLSGNVLDPNKSGGLFVNGNAASLFGSVAALLLCVAARRTMHRWLYAFAALSFAGSVCTGSKSVVVIGAGAALLILFLPQLRRGSAVFVAVATALTVPIALPALTGFVERVAPSFYASSDLSYGSREWLWTRAAQMFQESPILGPGFGGWVEQIGKIGSRSDLPPHNLLIATWAYSGIVAAALAITFMLGAIAFGVRVAAAQYTIRDRRTAAFVVCALAWVFLHGMGDNTTLYIEIHGMVLVAVAFGYLYALDREREQKSADTGIDQIPGTAALSEEAPRSSSLRRHQLRQESGSRRTAANVPTRLHARGRAET